LAQAEIGIIGGSGLYSMPGLTDVQEVAQETPFGTPSDAYVLGTPGDWRMIPTIANGQPAVVVYHRDAHG